MGNRILRLSAATLLRGAVGVTVAPHTTSYVSTSAVVNAPVVSVKAPFDGVITEASPEAAAAVLPGTAVLGVGAERQSRSEQGALEASASVIHIELDAIDRQIGRMEALRADLEARFESHSAMRASWLQARRDEARAVAGGTTIRRDRLADALERSQRLADAGTLAQARLDQEAAELAEVEMEVARQPAREAALDIEARAIAEGVALGSGETGGTDGGGYARRKLDDVDIRLVDLTAQRAILSARQAAVEAQVDALRAEAEDRRTFAPVASSASVVWRASAAAGASVATGDEVVELLDCDRRFVEVAIGERHFERIRPGSRATVLLKGSDAPFSAEVEAVRGAGAQFVRRWPRRRPRLTTIS